MKTKMINQTLKIAGLILGVSLTAPAMAADVVIGSFGGSYQEAQRKALFEPAASKMGISVNDQTYGGISDIRLKVKAGAMEWDLVASGAVYAARAAEEGLLEAIDYDVVDVSTFEPDMYTDTCVGTIVFSTVLAWNTETFGAAGPKSWADFWDVEKFPGTRAMRNKFDGNFEVALLADGVPLEQVYEVLSTEAGMQRAINKLRELKPHVAVWWKSGAQHAQLMKDGEVDMTTGWNGRFDAAKKDGAKVSYDFNEALLEYECWAMPKGAPNRETAMRFLNEISSARIQANLPKYINYGPANKGAYAPGLIDEQTARALPSHPDNARLQLQMSTEWYAKNAQKATALFQDMMTE